MNNRLHEDQRIRLKFPDMRHNLFELLVIGFRCTGSQFIHSQHDINFAELFILKFLINGPVFIIRHHIHDIPDVSSSLNIVRRILPSRIHFQCIRSGITDKHRIIQITLIHIRKRSAFFGSLLFLRSLGIRFQQCRMLCCLLGPRTKDIRRRCLPYIILIGLDRTLPAKVRAANKATDDQKHRHRVLSGPIDPSTHPLHLLKSEI